VNVKISVECSVTHYRFKVVVESLSLLTYLIRSHQEAVKTQKIRWQFELRPSPAGGVYYAPQSIVGWALVPIPNPSP